MDARLDLNKVIRPTLVRLEDSIILSLFERAQFKTNDIIYVPNRMIAPGFEGSYLDFMLRGTEELHAKAGRYLHSQEHPFFDNLPAPIVEREVEQSPIKSTDVNINDKIRSVYINALQHICEKGDDLHYGSSAVCDINCLQLLSKRIHYGAYVAESKFQQDPKTYTALIENRDIAGIKAKLTDKAVELAIAQRVRQKGEKYGVDPRFIEEFYTNEVIPLTVEVEIEYFMKRGRR